jgi:hypothetical protein
VLRGDRLYQFDQATLRLLRTHDFAAEPAAPAASPFDANQTGRRVVPAAASLFGPALERALAWLAKHQDADGRWNADEFAAHDPADARCDGAGNPVHDIGVTGLAMLAMLASGSTLRSGPHQEHLQRASDWLVQQQQANGQVGLRASHDFIYDHAIATFALSEACALSQRPGMKPMVQAAVDYLLSHRNPYAVWRYEPRDNDNDTSVTTWALHALVSAQDCGCTVDPTALKMVATWYDAVTEANGRAGYTKAGEPSSRRAGAQARAFPRERGEALTAAALAGRTLLGQDPQQQPILRLGADLVLAKPPHWQPEQIDAYYWFFGTRAMYQLGGRHWDAWQPTLRELVDAQRRDGPCAGSWDAVGVWDQDGGRVYATALYAWTLATAHRHTRLVR